MCAKDAARENRLLERHISAWIKWRRKVDEEKEVLEKKITLLEAEDKHKDKYGLFLENKLDALNRRYHDILRKGCRAKPFLKWTSWTDMPPFAND